jgi:hypothetical protein
VRVRRGEQPAEVRVAARDSTSSVTCAPPRA